MITLDPASDVPAYEQLRALLVAQIESGERAAGEALPTVRALAEELGLAPNTVAKAYKRLEQDGFTVTAGRRGTLVADQDPAVGADALRQARGFVASMERLGLSPGETSRLVRQVLHE